MRMQQQQQQQQLLQKQATREPVPEPVKPKECNLTKDAIIVLVIGLTLGFLNKRMNGFYSKLFSSSSSSSSADTNGKILAAQAGIVAAVFYGVKKYIT